MGTLSAVTGRHRSKGMYSPRIPEEYVPALYRLARERRVPMTRLVAEAIAQLLATEEGQLKGKEAEDETE